MHLCKAILVVREFEKGWPIFNDDVPLGKEYTVDLDKQDIATVHNLETGQKKQIQVIWVHEPLLDGGWLPLEALRLVTN